MSVKIFEILFWVTSDNTTIKLLLRRTLVHL
jgi:hypothetical protein